MRLKEIRTRRNMTRAQVAQALGISVGVYYRYETGLREPSVGMLVRMADLFEVSVGYLLGRLRPEGDDLSEAEIRVLVAFRQADDRAREDALRLLTAHKVEV